MHPGTHARTSPDKVAYVLEPSGVEVTYAELEARSNQLAHYFRSLGLKKGDHIAFMAENHPLYFVLAWGAHRAGLYYTAISTRLGAEETAYIVDNSRSEVFITTAKMAAVATEIITMTPWVKARLSIDGPIPGHDSYEDAVGGLPTTPIADEAEGADMLYSSGTTGRPKGVLVPLPEVEYGEPPGLLMLVQMLMGFDSDMVYLSPAPLYHAAPLRFCMAVLRLGGKVVVMEKFDAEEALRLIEKHRVTHSQWVPTMFIRMFKLPPEVRDRYDLSSHRMAVHAAAPCPREVKSDLIDWWGPIVHEYYAGSEGNGFVYCNSEQWLAHPGTVGTALSGIVHICDDEGNEVPTGESGTIYFEGGGEFTYHGDEEKTRDSRHPDNEHWSTLGDVGYMDEEGFIYLTDRKAFMIISGGVNIYPQEAENRLILHPKVMDAAVIGVPHDEFGEEVKAVVQPIDMAEAGPELERELIAWCREGLADVKCPRSVDFEPELPRHPTGKLYKRLLKDRYWSEAGRTI
ncbi:MAG TPA: acyl-CoA synthetase [Acidimicrobiales bacterium]|nr:acyl-CoA synthetase [Acidimicrobiales bacterium]